MKIPAAVVVLVILAVTAVHAVGDDRVVSENSITDRRVEWPTWDQWSRVLLLRDYNTRIVVIGATLLGCAAGMVGSFTLLRKRALMGDALSHATLPGIVLAFIVVTKAGGDGKSLIVLHIGAVVTGLLGVAAILGIRRLTHLKEDTALGAVLSVFFGAGVALLGISQQMPEGNSAGLESFIYGKTASMRRADIYMIAVAAGCCISFCLLLFKELKVLCFDDGFAGSQGFPVLGLDIILMALVVVVTIVGLQAVGLILMIALLVIPAAAARFWTERLGPMFVIAGCLGGLSGTVGAATSALFSKLPSGAMIVLVCTSLFLFSLVFGTARGVLVRFGRRWRLNRSVSRQHLLRAIFEIVENADSEQPHTEKEHRSVSVDDLLPKRSWTRARLTREIQRAQSDELVEWVGSQIRLTKRGTVEARRLTRQHRLWELYLITHADIAPSRVDRDADDIEHVLEPVVVAELERLLERERPAIPESPHSISPNPSDEVSVSQGGR